MVPGIGSLGGNAAEAALKEAAKAAQKAGAEAAEQAAIKTAQQAAVKAAASAAESASANAIAKNLLQLAEDAAEKAGRVGATNADRLAATAAKNPADKAAEAAAKKAAEAAAAKATAENMDNFAANFAKLDPKAVDSLSKNSKILNWMAKNPGTSLAIAAGAVFGAVVIANAVAMYEANNNKQLTIISMIPPDKTKITAVQITYSPNTKISNGDTITINDDTNIVPTSIINQTINIDKIVSDTQINATIPSLTTPASSGTFTLHTTIENCITQAAADTVSDTGNIFSSVIDKAKDIFGPALLWIVIAVGLIIGIPLLIFFIKLIMKIIHR